MEFFFFLAPLAGSCAIDDDSDTWRDAIYFARVVAGIIGRMIRFSAQCIASCIRIIMSPCSWRLSDFDYVV